MDFDQMDFCHFSRLRIEVTRTHQLCKQTLTLTLVCVSLRSHVSSNVALIKLQKQLADRSDAVTELEGRFAQLQEVRLKSSDDECDVITVT